MQQTYIDALVQQLDIPHSYTAAMNLKCRKKLKYLVGHL